LQAGLGELVEARGDQRGTKITVVVAPVRRHAASPLAIV
jgi:hypothetical protein